MLGCHPQGSYSFERVKFKFFIITSVVTMNAVAKSFIPTPINVQSLLLAVHMNFICFYYDYSMLANFHKGSTEDLSRIVSFQILKELKHQIMLKIKHYFSIGVQNIEKKLFILTDNATVV